MQRFSPLVLLLALALEAADALRPVFFDTHGRLERGKSSTGALQKLYVPVCDGESLLTADGDAWRPTLLSEEDAAPLLQDEGTLEAFLGTAQTGVLGSADYWLLDVSHLDEPPELGDGTWKPLRARAGPSPCDTLHSDEAALLGTARGMAHWHRSVKFCANCGSANVRPYREGKGRQCADCKARFRPRLDASVIVLVTDAAGERCLLGRKAEWPAGRYSTLAGFLEFGETLDECVAREVQEESGVAVERSSIRYVASQPWLFPRSMMVGFVVRAQTAPPSSPTPPLVAASKPALRACAVTTPRLLGCPPP